MMKKILSLLFCFLIFNSVQAYTIDDYLLFQAAQKSYREKNYKDAILRFRSLEDSFKSSPIVSSNYFKFFYAQALYENGDLPSAAALMEESIYAPQNLQGRNYFYQEREYYLARIALDMKNFQAALPHLKALIIDPAVPQNEKYEKFAFSHLKKTDEKYQSFYDLKLHNDFSNLNLFTKEELEPIGKYFSLKKNYRGQEKIYAFLMEKYPENSSYISQYLSALYLQKKSGELLLATERLQKTVELPEIFYFRGLGFLMNRDYPLALANLEKSLYLDFKYKKNYGSRPARELIAVIYSTLGDYSQVMSLLEMKGTPLSRTEETLLIEAYFRSGNFETAGKISQDFLVKFPFTPAANNFYYLLTGPNYRNKNRDNANEFLDENILRQTIFVNSHLVSKMSDFTLDLKSVHKNPEVQRIFKVAKLKDPELLRLAMTQTRFLARDPISSAYLVTQLYELGGFYRPAFENSLKNRDFFFRHGNLAKLLYPRYFQKEVASASTRYGVPENILYTAIRFKSRFNADFSGENMQMGLMGIESLDRKKSGLSAEALLLPQNNINLGAEKLRILLRKNRGVKAAALIEYCMGEDAAELLEFKKGDFSLDRIKDPILKERIRELISTYIFYEIFYPEKI